MHNRYVECLGPVHKIKNIISSIAFMLLSKYPKLTFFLLNLSIAVLLLLLTGYIVMQRLDSYTRHGYSISVPAFYNLTREEANRLAEKNDLKVIIVDSLYDEKAIPGTVREQYPLNGEKVKANRMIQLTVSAYNPEQVIFPQLNNSSYRQTLQILKAKGFQIGNIEYAPSEFKNLVLQLKYNDREIEPGTFLRKGVKIDIVLGDGGNEVNYVSLPRLCGLKTQDAIRQLQENYLNIGEIVPDFNAGKDPDISSAIVYVQEPAYFPNTTVPAGSYINLQITRDKKRIAALDSLIVTE